MNLLCCLKLHRWRRKNGADEPPVFECRRCGLNRRKRVFSGRWVYFDCQRGIHSYALLGVTEGDLHIDYSVCEGCGKMQD